MGNTQSGNRILAFLLAMLLVCAMLPMSAFAAEITWEEAYQITGDYLESQTHTIGADWTIIGLSRSGREISEAYYDLLVSDIKETVDENNRLHRSKATENARAIMTLTAMGMDATDVEGIDLVAGLGSMDFVKKQGLSGVIWTLIALDSGNYADSGDVTRDALIQIILDVECADGGWATSGSYADPDMTAMALQAIAPYCESSAEVEAAADRAVGVLSNMQKDDGGFVAVGLSTSESVAQVIVALAALGIDPDTDARFIKKGTSAVDALLGYFVSGGGFRHTMDGDWDGIATEQGYYALAAYARFVDGKTRLYDMTDVLDKGSDVTEPGDTGDDQGGFPWLAVIVVASLAVSSAAVVVIYRKKNRR